MSAAHCPSAWHGRSSLWLAAAALAVFMQFSPVVANAVQLVVERAESDASAPSPKAETGKPESLIPHARPAHGERDIAIAWLAGPTRRYPHGVLGDAVEASALRARTPNGSAYAFELPTHRVFEDLDVRLADLDADGRDEMVVVESDRTRGAALAVYGLGADGIELRARSPFIERANRWLNPVGAGDFDGDGQLDLAVVRTPHIGGVLEIYRYAPPRLVRVASAPGFSTHAIGSTALGLGAVVPAGGGEGQHRAWLLLPNQWHTRLALVALADGQVETLAATELQGRLDSALRPVADGFEFSLADGTAWRVRVTP